MRNPEEGGYDAIHCNTPTGGVLGRLCARAVNKERTKKGQKPIYVIYQAHGFHFWKGAPKKNWLLFYPVEKFLATWTNMLVTINQEDYEAAKKFRLANYGKTKGRLILHPGVGVNIAEFRGVSIDRDMKRAELGVNPIGFCSCQLGNLSSERTTKCSFRQ